MKHRRMNDDLEGDGDTDNDKLTIQFCDFEGNDLTDYMVGSRLS